MFCITNCHLACNACKKFLRGWFIVFFHFVQGFHFSVMISVPFDYRVTVRGQPDEDAVICTESKTYAIKSVGTSNSVFSYPHLVNLIKIQNVLM